MLKPKLQSFGHLMWRADLSEKTLMLGKIEDRRRRGWQRMRWLDGITQWTWVWANSKRWWRTGKPQFNSVQSLSHVRLFATPWTAARQASLSITHSRSLFKLMSIESVMASNHLILCHALLLLPSIFPNIRVFSNESALHIRWPKYWSFSFKISPSNEHPGLISF